MVILPDIAEKNAMALLVKAVQETCVGIQLRFDWGFTEEGDPWWSAVSNTGMMVAHLGREQLPDGSFVYHYLQWNADGELTNMTRGSLIETYEDIGAYHRTATARVAQALIQNGCPAEAVSRSMNYSTRKKGKLRLLPAA